MAQVLSQAEIDALLSAVNDGEAPAGDEQDAGVGKEAKGDINAIDVVPYDLTSQDKVIRGRMPILEIIYERFIRSFRVSLSTSLRKISTITMLSTDLIKFGEFVNTLPTPACICIMRFNELRGPALMIFEFKLAYSIIDAFFGGSDRTGGSKVEGKEFSSIELTFMKKVMDMAISDLEEAWATIHRIEAQYLRTEINPQFLGIVPPSDVVIATSFDVEFESASGVVTIVIPYSTIEPIKQKLSSTFQTDNEMIDSLWTHTIKGHLEKTSANLSIKLGESMMTIGDLLTLEVGDIIALNQDASEELPVAIEGIEKMKCIIGSRKGNRAIQITKLMSTD